MARNPRVPAKYSLKAPPKDGDGNHIHNQILLDLPPKECEMLFPKLEFVRVRTHHVLHEPGDTLKSAYFCDSGLISILSVFPDGKVWKWVWSVTRALWACHWLLAFAPLLLAP